MRNPRVIMRTGLGQVQDPPDLKTFSLPELSFLIKILNIVELDEVYNVDHFEDIQDILVTKGGTILDAAGLSANNRNIFLFQRKIESAINYFRQVITGLEEQIKERYGNLDIQAKHNFIENRLDDYRGMVSQDVFYEFTDTHDADIQELYDQPDLDDDPDTM
uniref:Uncharacterized protein n=1 Tax=Meloidogyne floridensis TaxID=298350 RepID=A0A915NP25_9BILA